MESVGLPFAASLSPSLLQINVKLQMLLVKPKNTGSLCNANSQMYSIIIAHFCTDIQEYQGLVKSFRELTKQIN